MRSMALPHWRGCLKAKTEEPSPAASANRCPGAHHVPRFSSRSKKPRNPRPQSVADPDVRACLANPKDAQPGALRSRRTDRRILI